VALVVVLVVISLGIHEAAHGWVALKCGDTTARDLGRITLNPLPHIDPFMTVVLPAITLMAGGILFGGAKPVPVNFHKLRHPYRDMALVAMAGPLSNFLLAALFLVFWKVMVQDLGLWQRSNLGPVVLGHAMFWNLLLAAFNLMPIPPLDGSRVMTWLLPRGLRESYANLERFGLFLVVLLVFFVPQAKTLLYATLIGLSHAIEWLVTLGGLW